MTKVGMFEAKTHFSQLVDQLLSGQTEYVSVLRRGKPVVRIVLESQSTPKRDLSPIYSGKIKERNCDWFADESDLWEEA